MKFLKNIFPSTKPRPQDAPRTSVFQVKVGLENQIKERDYDSNSKNLAQLNRNTQEYKESHVTFVNDYLDHILNNPRESSITVPADLFAPLCAALASPYYYDIVLKNYFKLLNLCPDKNDAIINFFENEHCLELLSEKATLPDDYRIGALIMALENLTTSSVVEKLVICLTKDTNTDLRERFFRALDRIMIGEYSDPYIKSFKYQVIDGINEKNVKDRLELAGKTVTPVNVFCALANRFTESSFNGFDSSHAEELCGFLKLLSQEEVATNEDSRKAFTRLLEERPDIAKRFLQSTEMLEWLLDCAISEETRKLLDNLLFNKLDNQVSDIIYNLMFDCRKYSAGRDKQLVNLLENYLKNYCSNADSSTVEQKMSLKKFLSELSKKIDRPKMSTIRRHLTVEDLVLNLKYNNSQKFDVEVFRSVLECFAKDTNDAIFNNILSTLKDPSSLSMDKETTTRLAQCLIKSKTTELWKKVECCDPKSKNFYTPEERYDLIESLLGEISNNGNEEEKVRAYEFIYGQLSVLEEANLDLNKFITLLFAQKYFDEWVKIETVNHKLIKFFFNAELYDYLKDNSRTENWYQIVKIDGRLEENLRKKQAPIVANPTGLEIWNAFSSKKTQKYDDLYQRAKKEKNVSVSASDWFRHQIFKDKFQKTPFLANNYHKDDETYSSYKFFSANPLVKAVATYSPQRLYYLCMSLTPKQRDNFLHSHAKILTSENLVGLFDQIFQRKKGADYSKATSFFKKLTVKQALGMYSSIEKKQDASIKASTEDLTNMLRGVWGEDEKFQAFQGSKECPKCEI